MSRRFALFLLLLAAFASPSLAVPGATDRVPAASLLVPFFEVGINPAVKPENTFLTVNNRAAGVARIHYHVWDVTGKATALHGNVAIGAQGTWSATLRDLINPASAAVKTQLNQGAFYRGFVTIDLVTAFTGLPPTDSSFPFANANRLEGYIYYARFPDMVSGLAMVPLEAFPGIPEEDALTGFYSHPLFKHDNREDLGPFARVCASRRAAGQTCGSIDYTINRIDMRVFLSSAPSRTRLIIFAWDPRRIGGPSVHCDEDAGGCGPTSTFAFRRFNEAGTLIDSQQVRLDNVVNVGEITGTQSGWASLVSLPSVFVNTNFYAFSFNTSAPGWDALFEAFIDP